jgi:aspartyl aminopeptidase
MRLIYKETGEEVKVGDKVRTGRGEEVTVAHFDRPHKPSSSGKVMVHGDQYNAEYYVGVIGAEWIEREDRL